MASRSGLQTIIAERGSAETKRDECVAHFCHAWHFDFVFLSAGVADLFANCSDKCPESLILVEEVLIGDHLSAFSNRPAKSMREMPSAWHTACSSIMSRRRSPDSYLLTNDCGFPRRSARSTWRRPV